MAEKQFNTRIIHKHDTAENWAKATNFIPKKGELIVYDIDAEYNYERIKLGDGVKTINELEFLQSDNYPIIKKTGSIVTARSLDGLRINPTTFIEPVQSGSGDPYPAGSRKNICPGVKVGYAYNNTTGALFASSAYNCTELTPVEDGLTYVESNSANLGVTDIHCYDSNQQWIGKATAINSRPTGTAYIALNYYVEAAGTNISWVQIEQGATPTAYAPYANVRPINGWDSVEVQRAGKNLIKPARYLSASRNTTLDGDVFTTEFTAGSLFFNSSRMYYLPEGTYTTSVYATGTNLNCVIYAYRADGSQIGRKSVNISDGEMSSYTFTADTPFIVALGGYWTEDGSRFGTYSYRIMLETGTATTYEPCQGQTLTADLPETVYGGTLDWTTGVLTIDHKNVGMNDIQWQYSEVDKRFFVVMDDFPVIETAMLPEALCSIYKPVTFNDFYNDVDGTDQSFAIIGEYLFVRDLRYTTVSDFTAAVLGQTICYRTSSPQEIQFTPQQLKAIDGTNNVWSNSGDTEAIFNLTPSTKINSNSAGTELGTVKTGGDVTITDGVITINDDSHNHVISNVDGLQSALDAKATPANITSAIAALDYTSPKTSGTALEFITTVNQADGVVSATKAAIPVASSNTLGLVKSGTDITVDASGNVSVNDNSHSHTIANVTNLQSTLDAKATPAQITSAIAALDASDPTASGTATSFISTISQTDGVISATKASLPTAGTSLGMVKSGGDVTISSGTITVNDDSHNHIISNIDGLQDALNTKATPGQITEAIGALDAEDPEAEGTSTTFISTVSETDGVITATKASIPTANSTTLGMVKAGGDVTISNGVISVVDDSHNHVISNVDGLQDALNAKATPANITSAIAALDYTGATASGNATSFITQVTQTDGVVSATKASIPIATSSQAGLVKSGTDITVDSNGNVSVNNNSHSHTSANISDLSTTINTAITNAIGALDASDPTASGSATQFITSISQKDGVITATKANITAAALGLSGAMKFLGTSATAITDGATTNPITIGSTSTTVASGNVVLYGSKEFVWTGSTWEELGNEGSYKVQQSAVSSPATSGSTTAFIDTISQNAQGVITATKKNVTFPTLSGGSAAAADATVVGGVTVSGHAVTVGKKTLTAGNNVTITGAADKITIAATDTKYSTMGAATASTAGTSGLVPAPAAGKQGQYLRGDGTWATPTNTTYNAATTSTAGLMSAADKTKLDGITANADTVAFTQNATSGNKVGTITINGTATDMYSPTQTSVSGNAGTATTLKTARTIDGVSFNGSAAITHYGECSTAAATVAKTVALTGFTLVTGARIAVKFTVTNTASNPTLNVNSTGAKAIMYRGSAITKGCLAANRVYEFVYDGTDWELIGDINTDTHYTTRLYAGASGAVANAAETSPYLTVTDNNTYRNQVRFVGSGATTVSSDANGNITISSTDNNTTYSAATQSAAGLMSADDKKKLDGIATGATANTGDITGVTAGNGLTGGGSSGSVTLNVGAGSGITVAADTVSVNTSYTTSGKNYKVAVDSTTGGLYVNVPWTDNNTDTKNTAGSTNSDSKLFLIGATSQAANPQTYSDSEVYTTNGTLTAKTFSGSGASLTSLNASNISSGTIAAARLPAATTSAQGAMTSAMVTKLNGIAAGATADTAITTAEINGVCV